MKTSGKPIRLGLLCAGLACLSSAAGRVDAAPVFTGDGAQAWVSGFYEWSDQVDGRPASLAGTKSVEYTRVPPGAGRPEPASIPVTYTVSALANPAGAHLLELRSRGSSPNPGDTVGPRTPSPDLNAVAGWTNVVATVGSPSGAPLPGSIRLDFEVAYTRPETIHTDLLGSQSFNRDQSIWLSREVDGYASNTSYGLPGEGGRILADQTAVAEGPDGLLHMGFHLDLAVSPDGVSDRFGLGLESRIPAMVEFAAVDNLSVMNLTLKGVTLPDGTALEAAGYTLGFESGLTPLPDLPVPEPAAWLAWTCLAAASARLIRRRRAA